MITVLKLFARYIAHHERALNVFDKRKKATLTGYYTKYNTLQDFLSEKKLLELKAEEFKISTAREYFDWLCNKKFTHNYSIRVVQVIKAAFNFGVMNEIIKYNQLYALKIPKLPPKYPVFLTIKEVISLIEYQPTKSMEQKAKDMFLFQCFTGMDYTDTVSVRKHHVVDYKGRDYLKKPRNKTGEESCVPYSPEVKFLFEKYNCDMKLLSNAKYNLALKGIAEGCNIEKHLTTHVGRKTFAMTMLNENGYGLVPLSKMLGHKKYSTTETYYTRRTIELVHSAVVDYESRQTA